MTWNPFVLAREARALRARVSTLEFAIQEANAWLKSGEGVDLLHFWPEHSTPSFRAEIARLIPDEWGRP